MSASIAAGQVVVGVNGQAAPPAAQPAVVQVTQFDAAGTLAGVKPGAVTLLLPNQQTWQVLIDSPQFNAQSKTQMELHAPAKASILQPGFGVRFAANFDDRGRPEGPIESLTVFTPNLETRFGAFSEEQLGVGVGGDHPAAPANDADAPRLGIGLVPGPDGQKGVQIDVPQPQPAPHSGPPKHAEPPKGAKAEGRYLVVGKISRVRRDELSLALPGKTIAFKLSPEAKIDAEFTDKSIIARVLQVGDPIHVTGFYQQAGTAYANQIKINLERALGDDIASAPSRLRKPDAPKEGAGAAHADQPAPQGPFAPAEAPAGPARPAVRVLKIN